MSQETVQAGVHVIKCLIHELRCFASSLAHPLAKNFLLELASDRFIGSSRVNRATPISIFFADKGVTAILEGFFNDITGRDF